MTSNVILKNFCGVSKILIPALVGTRIHSLDETPHFCWSINLHYLEEKKSGRTDALSICPKFKFPFELV